MKRIMSVFAAGALALAGVALVEGTASAATTTPTITLSGGSAVAGISPGPITATTSVAGTVTFTANGTTISGCSGVTTVAAPAPATNFTATCMWAPTVAGPVALGATFTPTDTTDYTTATAATDNVKVGAPVQQGNLNYPISLYVDTVIGGGATGAIAPIYGGCQITNEFLLGQTVVFRVYGNDADLKGAPLTPLNVSSASVTVSGVATPLPLVFGNHGGVAFWTAALKTGTGAGLYSTLGIINYKVTVNTIAIPAVTKVITAYRNVKRTVNHKVVVRRLAFKKRVVVTPAVPGATGTFSSSFTPVSQATLNAVPTT